MEHMERTHSLLSPSGAHRWLVCTPSARAEKEVMNQYGNSGNGAGVYADEGTLAHEWAAYLLNPEGNEEPFEDADSDMRKYVEDYAAFVKELAEGGELYVETQTDLSSYIPEGRGIVDVAIVSDDVLYIVDFKYGAGVPVYAEQNPQMMCYALGMLEKLGHAKHFRLVSMTIYQPRCENVSTWQITEDDLMMWAKNVLRPTAIKAWNGEGEYVAGKHCQFCKAKDVCRTRGNDAIAILKEETPILSEEERKELICKIPAMISFLQDLWDYAEKDAIENGTEYPGTELKISKPRRKWDDPEGAAAWFIANGHSDMVKCSPPGITESEKELGKAQFDMALARYVGATNVKPKLQTTIPKQIK